MKSGNISAVASCHEIDTNGTVFAAQYFGSAMYLNCRSLSADGVSLNIEQPQTGQQQTLPWSDVRPNLIPGIGDDTQLQNFSGVVKEGYSGQFSKATRLYALWELDSVTFTASMRTQA